MMSPMTMTKTAQRRHARHRTIRQRDGPAVDVPRRLRTLAERRADDGTNVDRQRRVRDGPAGPPPAPPLSLTPLVACDPATDMEVLWHIARDVPHLRRWLVANPQADAALLEFVAQSGGPGVREALTVLLGD
ncbi:hypothetical protein DSM100688_0843 [Bifidobacterium ramosum]|nr:hypothetical protein DSM100688_0843 [Bifidobacterium ramosum]